MALVKVRNDADDGWIEIGGGVQIIQQDSAPSSTNPGMLWLDTDESHGMAIISESLALYIATDGNDTTGDGDLSNPWLTIARALEWLADYRILPSASVSVNLAPGTYAHASRIELTHMDGDKISIQAGTPETLTTSSVASYTGSVDNWSVTMNCADTGALAVGDMIGIGSATGGTRPEYVQGAFEVTAVVADTSFTFYSGHRDTLTASGNVVATVRVFNTILDFDNYGFRAQKADAGCALANLAIVGSYDGTSGYGIHVMNGAVMRLATCATMGFTYGWLTVSGGGCHATSTCYFGVPVGGEMYGATNCGAGTSITINYCYVIGCQIASYAPGGCISALYAFLTGSAYGVYSAYNGHHYASFITCTGISSTGVYATAFGFNHVVSSVVTNCTVAYSPLVNTSGNEEAYNNT